MALAEIFAACFLADLAAQFVMQRGWRWYRRVGAPAGIVVGEQELRCNHCGKNRLVTPSLNGHICPECSAKGKL